MRKKPRIGESPSGNPEIKRGKARDGFDEATAAG